MPISNRVDCSAEKSEKRGAVIKANIIIAGVGGQGTLLASRIIGGAAIKSGCDVKVSEVHGMSQRGGSVITYVKHDTLPVHSPIIDEGCADFVLAFELLEAYRCVPYLKKNTTGRMITNTQTVDPMPVISGAAVYPSEIVPKIKALDIMVDALDAQTLAERAGSVRAVNVVLIGRLASALGFTKEIWLDVLKESVKPAFLEFNYKAFEMGYQWKDTGTKQ